METYMVQADATRCFEWLVGGWSGMLTVKCHEPIDGLVIFRSYVSQPSPPRAVAGLSCLGF